MHNWPDVLSLPSPEGRWRLAAAGGETEDRVDTALKQKGKPWQAPGLCGLFPRGRSVPSQPEGCGGQFSLPFSARTAGLLLGPFPLWKNGLDL